MRIELVEANVRGMKILRIADAENITLGLRRRFAVQKSLATITDCMEYYSSRKD